VVISLVGLHGSSLVVLVRADEAVDGLWLRFVTVDGLSLLVADRLLGDWLVADDRLRLLGHRLVMGDSLRLLGGRLVADYRLRLLGDRMVVDDRLRLLGHRLVAVNWLRLMVDRLVAVDRLRLVVDDWVSTLGGCGGHMMVVCIKEGVCFQNLNQNLDQILKFNLLGHHVGLGCCCCWSCSGGWFVVNSPRLLEVAGGLVVMVI